MTKLTSLLAALALTCCCAVPAALAQDASKIGVANTNQIATQIRESKDIMARVQEKGKTLDQQLNAKKAAVNALQEARNQFKPDSEQYREKNAELMRQQIELESWFRINKADLDREKKQTLASVYSKIESAVAEVAKQRGLDVVIADQRGDIPNVEQIEEAQLGGLLRQRIVLYAGPKADITNDVIAYMDKNYTAPAGSPSTSGGAATPAPAGK